MTIQIISVMIVYILVLVTPGPNFAMIMALAGQGKKTAAYLTGIGFSLGAVTLAILSMAGLISLLTYFPAAKITLGLAASGVLIWRGVQGLKASARTDPIQDRPSAMVEQSHRPLRALAEGYLYNFANPKALAFFIGIFGAEMSSLPLNLVVWVLVACLLLEVVWYTFLAWALHTEVSQRLLQRARSWVSRVTGSFLIFFALGNIIYLARSVFENSDFRETNDVTKNGNQLSLYAATGGTAVN